MNWYKKAQLYNKTRKEYQNFDKNVYDPLSEEERDIYWKNLRKREDEWDTDVSRSLAIGKLSPEEAHRQGYDIRKPDRGDDRYSINGEGKISPLPEILYHVTTSKGAVISDQLKTRDELDQGSGVGLGGGTDNTISFTENLEIAKDIYRTIVEGRRATTGDLGIEEMISDAKNGIRANNPWDGEWIERLKTNIGVRNLEEIRDYVNTDYEINSSMFPETVEGFLSKPTIKDESDKWSPVESSRIGNDKPFRYRQFKKLLTPQEKAYRKFKIYHVWAWERQHAGGPEYGLFIFNDANALAAVPEDQIAILEFKSRPRSMGYQVSALGEWRTWSGQAVDFVKEIQYELV